MVAFQVSTNSQHQCMPVMAEFDLPGIEHDERRAIMLEMDELVKKIVDNIPVSEWHGIARWAKALGYYHD
jgi:DNA-binding PucR family transcriptional regulator